MTTPILLTRMFEEDDDLAATVRICAADAVAGRGSFEVEWDGHRSEGLESLGQKGMEDVLPEFSLPDSRGIETFEKLFIAAADASILILDGNLCKALTKQAAGRRAQGCLLSGHLDYTRTRNGPSLEDRFPNPNKPSWQSQ